MKARMEASYPAKAHHHIAPVAALVLVFLPLFYIASTGPVSVLCDAGYVSEEAFYRVYAPLIDVSESFEPFGRLMEAYVELWMWSGGR